ncbi:tetratricopeptide repeat protein [Legionella israelensis]|uniref:tetratricopeptide repeat protein n=1 Tax=Legionella israelensis TaxID=454 RepID=UPI00117DEE8B|nr:tetratricopeptide repeat protein [Legionella israelensis]QDP73028.1 tetratricopeptide repeat protein [Legionella israelensis]
MSEWLAITILVVAFISAMFLALYPLRKQPLFSGCLSLVMALAVAFAYWSWGSFTQWRQYVYQTEQQKVATKMLQTLKTPEQLAEKLKAKLNDKPESAKGWYLLGRLYDTQGKWQEAVDSYAKAHRLMPEEISYTIYYAQGLWRLNQQQFTMQIRELYYNILKKNPEQPDALAMLAMDSFLSHDYERAIDYWERLLKLAPPQSEEAVALRKAIARAQKQLEKGNHYDKQSI